MAVPMSNGRVFIAGGFNSVLNSLSTAEYFDPLISNFRSAGQMTASRAGSTATLLPNGNILIVGGLSCGAPGSSGCVYLNSAELFEPTQSAFVATGSLNTARAFHTATLLANGTVLITGGQNSQGVTLASAEIYNPATGSFSPLSSTMTSPREFHTATLLPDGQVLIAGGENCIPNPQGGACTPQVLSSSELYNPSSQSFSSTGNMTSPREFHTATLLPDGQVLIAGGAPCPPNTSSSACPTPVLASAELFNSANNAFTATGSMTTPRELHTASLLQSGEVLIVGGVNTTGALSSAELYNPSTGSFSSLSNGLTQARDSAVAATLPDGSVLVVGGEDSTGTALASAELYNPQSTNFTIFRTMVSIRYAHTATLLTNGQVLLAGGANGAISLASAELFNPSTGLFSPTTGTMTASRAFHTATMLGNGQVLIAGGVAADGSALASAELYNPTQGLFSATSGPMTVARIAHGAAPLPDGTVLIVGGVGSNQVSLAQAEVYQPAQATFVQIGQMLTPRDTFTTTVLQNNTVLIAGGEECTVSGCVSLNAAELFNPANRTFSPTASPMNSPRIAHTATLLNDGTVLIAGGRDCTSGGCTSLSSAEIFNPATGTFSLTTGSMAQARDSASASLLSNGTVLIVGGEQCTPTSSGSACSPLTDAEIFNPSTQKFSFVGNLFQAVAGLTTTPLGSSSVLIAGGLSLEGASANAALFVP